ncbi:hypothetical protein SAMN05216188_14610 [Lentzea xinjiangensis]|uniref:Uncharacterized protein n=1 Tax=Lentzea xinjiangensis TaxID=402600 RepID=A0A1H9WVG6_9PSEU|nr:hypothetical protein [Lentzea xinjiangensis]SES37930.1 hypothetical protein SAMN05216188_14610 [Lentzea xinjiangensis]
MGRKQTMMPTVGGGGRGGRLMAVGIGLVLLGLILRDPVGAAHLARQAAVWFGSVLEALSSFGSALSQ